MEKGRYNKDYAPAAKHDRTPTHEWEMEYWVLQQYVLEVTRDHLNWYHSKAWVRFPIRLP